MLFLLLALTVLVPRAYAQTNKITTTLDGITFDSAYDNGSLTGISRRAIDDYDATLLTDVGEAGATAKYWFRFTMTGVTNRTVTLHLDHSQNPIPFIRSLDPGPGAWRRMTTNEAPNLTTLILTFGATNRTVELAFFDPLGYSETIAAVTNLVASSPYASMVTLGQSFEGRNLHLITINNTNYPDAGKRSVWVHARVHAGEVTATHAMLGFLSQALEDSETGRRLRQYIIFHIVPQINVDGIYRGHTRWDTQGIDPEAEWCGVRTPEVALIKTQVDSLMASSNPISVALNLHSTIGNFADSFFWKHLTPSVTTNYQTIQQNYINAVNAATPMFDNLAPQTSQLNACTFIESYFWNHWGESVMAMTEEGHFYRRITDNAWIMGADYREVGRGMARGLIAYYNLPPTAEPDGLPVVTTQPAAQILLLGQPLTLSVNTTSAPVSFQWWFNDAPIAGATNSYYTNIITQTFQAGAYAVALSNGTGSVTSSIARLVVINAQGTPIAFADDFDVNTSNRWNELPGYTNTIADYTAGYAFDYGTYFSSFLGSNLPPAPNSLGGTTRGLRLTVNNNDAIAATAAISLYPKWQSFSGAHALKFDMWINYPGGVGGAGASGSTEYACFGLDNSGNFKNWDSTTAAPSDGVWFTVTGEGGAAFDYRAYVGGTNNSPVALSFADSGLTASGATTANSASAPFTNYFPSPAYQTAGTPGKHWVQVEVSQTASNVLTWRINGNLIAQRTNNTAFTGGNVLLGMADVFPSIAGPAADAFIIYDNARVELDANALKPIITLQPTNQTIIVGQTATLTVNAIGLGPISYQWNHSTTNLAGITNLSYILPNVQVTDAGNYFAQVTNAAGGVISSLATLTVIPANTNSTPITATRVGANLQIDWPADRTGWRLEMQTNNLAVGLGTNWVTVPGSATTNQLLLNVTPAGSTFFRLVYP